jgi:hypothetical protein
MMTDWFPTGIAPTRDGCYITRREHGECWSFMRWCCKTGHWYSAGTEGTSWADVIGGNTDKHTYEWRGLKNGDQQ